ncbi:MAG: hypothetical protein F6J93_32725 [Oscillatoria sp. SIO1A7]|nr:hypothetical protein [Oscillatoria sp. SIO1A7]
MTATLEQIARYLDRSDVEYQIDAENSCIVSAYSFPFPILIDLQEDGQYMELAVPQLLQVQDHIYKGVLLQTLLAISWETKMLRWEYDPMDGEIRASIILPLEDAILTEQQFNRCLNSLVELVDGCRSRIEAVLQTGEDPKQKALGERLLLALEANLPPGSLDMLDKAIAARRQRLAA